MAIARPYWTFKGWPMPSHAGLLVGYGRTSTIEQRAGLEAQLRDLKAIGCKKVFQEQVSSVGERAQLEAALDYVREGDTLVVTKLDRLARSARGWRACIPALTIASKAGSNSSRERASNVWLIN